MHYENTLNQFDFMLTLRMFLKHKKLYYHLITFEKTTKE